MEIFEQLMKGNFENYEKMFNNLLPPFTDHVKQQRKRLGGDWAVAWAIVSQKQRNKARELLGDDVVFIVLNMTKECQKKRLQGRQGGTGVDLDVLNQLSTLYEPAAEGEKNVFNVDTTEDTSPEDVVKEVQ